MKTNHLLIIFVLLSTLLINLAPRVGALRSESQSVDLGDARSVRVEIELGTGKSMIDLSGDWVRDLDVDIDASPASVTVRLPNDISVRVIVGEGPHITEFSGLSRDGNDYTNTAYGVSDMTMQIDMEAVLARSTWK